MNSPLDVLVLYFPYFMLGFLCCFVSLAVLAAIVCWYLKVEGKGEEIEEWNPSRKSITEGEKNE